MRNRIYVNNAEKYHNNGKRSEQRLWYNIKGNSRLFSHRDSEKILSRGLFLKRVLKIDYVLAW